MARAHQRLDQAMNDRRVQLDMTWNELAARARIAGVTLRAIRKGSNAPSELTARRLEDALHWERGSIDAILDGGDPIPAEAEQRDPTELPDDLEANIEAVLVRRGYSPELARVAARSGVAHLASILDDLPVEHERREHRQERARRGA